MWYNWGVGPFLPLLVLLPSLLLGCLKPLVPSGCVSGLFSGSLALLETLPLLLEGGKSPGLCLESVFVWPGLGRLTWHTFFGSCSPQYQTSAKDPTQFLAPGHSAAFPAEGLCPPLGQRSPATQVTSPGTARAQGFPVGSATLSKSLGRERNLHPTLFCLFGSQGKR